MFSQTIPDPNPTMTPLKMHSDRARRFLTPLLALLLAIPAIAQVTAKPEEPKTEEQKAAEAKKNDVIKLSPFVVNTTKDAGYFAENTLAGSRLNSNLADLAASITVVTKQQMEDTASLDINDVFRYEASTEGSTSYTPQITDRGTMKDSIGGYSFGNNGDTTTNAQSNRVRGLSAPDASINYHPSNARIPFDSYNTQSVEISRGPNSLLFGMGSPSGIVNQSASQAVLNRNSETLTLRTDHLGSQRGSFAVNRSLIDDKLAIYVAALYNNQQFERQPSYDLTRRQYGAITFKPFPRTVIRGFAENYQNNANRPNFIMPRDGVTPWIKAGRPLYDPVARTITIQDTVAMKLANGTTLNRTAGQVLGPIYFNNRSPGYNPAVTTLVGTALITTATSPYYMPLGFTFDNANTSTLERLNNGEQIDYFMRVNNFYTPAHTNPATAVPNSNAWAVNDPRFLQLDRVWTSSSFDQAPPVTINGVAGSYSSYQAAGVSSQSIYDYTKYNLNEANFAYLRSGNYNLEIEQQITDRLFFSAGWFRQDIDSSENYTLSQLQGNTLMVDTNTKMPDGSPNPYVGLAYVPLGLGGGVDTFFAPETDDSYRAMLAYDLDFTQHSNWTKWLGRHRLLGLVSEQDVKRNRERWRLTYTDGNAEGRLRYGRNLTLDGQAFWSNSAIRKQYYVANPGDPSGTVTHSSGFYGNPGWQTPYTSQVGGYNFNTNDYHNFTLTERIAFSDAGSANFQREVKSWNLATQSFLWGDRLVATVGWRHDAYRARNTTAGAISDPNKLDPVTKLPVVLNPPLTANQLYPNHDGEAVRDLFMKRWILWDKLSGDTKTLGAAFRPLKGWASIERSADAGSVVSDFLRSLTLYYNQSDNFNPPPGAQTDYFRRALPKPTGDGKDGGFGFNLFNNKLVARVNWFETANQNERTSAAGNLLNRLIYSDTTTGIPWASAVVRIRNAVASGMTQAAYVAQTNWNDATAYPVTDAANQQKIYDLIQLPLNYYSGISVAATQQSVAKGTELQITYNPSANWTMKFTATKSKSVYTDVSPQYDEWLAERMPYWTTSAAPDITDFTDGNGRQYSLKQFWTGYGYTDVARIENTNGNTSAQAYHNNVVVTEVALAKALEGAVAPNQRIYHASFLTNYVFRSGKLNGFSVGGAERWESKAAVGFYGKASNPLLPTTINASDTTRPIYLDNGNFYTDLWVSYTRKIWQDKVKMKVQLNINNAFEGGGLTPIAANWDGLPWAYRIVDPRQFVLTTTFDF
jgi:outer membrane receptor protein involved in Fe transport